MEKHDVVSVPVEPTDEMLYACLMAGDVPLMDDDTYCAIYKAMVGAILQRRVVYRSDFERKVAELLKARRLLVEIYDQVPAVRSLIERRTGSWLALGVDRNADEGPARVAPEHQAAVDRDVAEAEARRASETAASRLVRFDCADCTGCEVCTPGYKGTDADGVVVTKGCASLTDCKHGSDCLKTGMCLERRAFGAADTVRFSKASGNG